jgi:alkyl sulfatase BDS1-like metallo-beta-lactamase superfamily hydrolase
MRSFDPDPSVTTTDQRGQRVHRQSLEQSKRLQRRLYTVRSGVWCLVGNGLSNQTFIEGPQGVIAIDTGESIEEMTSALQELRRMTQAPVAAVIYSHFHYLLGTRAIFAEAGKAVPVYGHERIPLNLARTGAEIAPAYANGLVHQFGIRLPDDGPDGQVNVGLGLRFRNPDHAPFTPGYAPPTITWKGGEELTIAGLRVRVTHAPSDSDDSITLWFPDLGVCVQNIVWPALFNIFPIRGEEYRDPQILLRGIDHVISLGAEYLVGAHGPPISGAAEITKRATRYRDSIQFLWDQTVRGLNKGLTADQLAHSVSLPSYYDDDYLTSEFYGVSEHHVRQIAGGVRGWFDGDPAKLFPLEPSDRAARLVNGFGGTDRVHELVREARQVNDLRWALELASWLVGRPAADARDRQAQADVLRDIATRTTAANIRNWCLTKARDVDGTTELSRLRDHRLRVQTLLAGTPRSALNVLRVMLDPPRAADIDCHTAFSFTDGGRVGLHVRNGVSVVTDGEGAAATIQIAWPDLAELLAGQASLSNLMASGRATIEGDTASVRRMLGSYDIPGLTA